MPNQYQPKTIDEWFDDSFRRRTVKEIRTWYGLAGNRLYVWLRKGMLPFVKENSKGNLVFDNVHHSWRSNADSDLRGHYAAHRARNSRTIVEVPRDERNEYSS